MGGGGGGGERDGTRPLLVPHPPHRPVGAPVAWRTRLEAEVGTQLAGAGGFGVSFLIVPAHHWGGVIEKVRVWA